LGLFSKESGVKSYVEKLENSGFSVITERIETTKGPRTLVLVGVFASKNQAELALERLNARKLTYGDAKIRQRKP
jgi:cell division septation protein DedD